MGVQDGDGRAINLFFMFIEGNSHPSSSGTRSFSTSTASANSNNKDIHTAKAWAEDDIRQARFVAAPKQTNERWAIDLVAQVPPKPVKTRVVACAGGPGALGHPIVYINLDKPGAHECIYCQQRFIKEDAHH